MLSRLPEVNCSLAPRILSTVKLSAPAKASSANFKVVASLTEIFVSPESSNALSPTLIIDSGRTISVIPSQPLNALTPMLETPSSIVMLVILRLDARSSALKASFKMFLIGFSFMVAGIVTSLSSPI